MAFARNILATNMGYLSYTITLKITLTHLPNKIRFELFFKKMFALCITAF